ncbi:hypothetical protein [Limnobaculum parvum]|uniref:Uncharacterized protein n=1 Tax=Limnobaculum parvum TaxID=2172103 RepID=A0A2Y9TWA7_9GAMM|nr:hypothetical protein [Limnobaculum parvum]AWH87902.1 hypothetical protein HYN51_04605 [Limnobaculum parvum]
MDVNLTTISGLIISVFPLIVPAMTLWNGWVFISDRLFTRRSQLSRFSYELYQRSGEVQFKKIAHDYGCAALIGDHHLSTEQRKVLLNSDDPIRDIDVYRKCSAYLNVNTSGHKFSWAKPWHKYRIFRWGILFFLTVLYFVGCVIFVSPMLYFLFRDLSFMAHFNEIALWKKIIAGVYFVFFGGFIAFISLNKGAKLHMAVRLISRNRLPS